MSWFSRLFGRSDASRQTAGTAAAVATATPPTPTDQPAMTRDPVDARPRQADLPYVLPNDMQEVNRLDFQHYMLRYALRGNYLAPTTAPQGILDIGCGTGRWALEIAQTFPDANVVGVDTLVPAEDAKTYYGLDRRPENYAFVQANVLQGLPFADNTFDYVHMRFLFLAIPEDQWPGVVRELVRVARPGAWIELVEGGFVVNPAPAGAIMNGYMDALHRMKGINIAAASAIGQYLRAAGVFDLVTRQDGIPMGRRFGRLGAMMESDIVAVGAAMRGVVVGSGLASAEQYDEQLARSQQELLEENYHGAFPIYIAYGRKAG